MSPRVALLAVLVVVVAACGSSGPRGDRLPDAASQPALAASPVGSPSPLISGGQLTVAIVPTLPVQQYLDHNQKPAGFDIDLVNAIGSQLGLKVTLVTAGSEDEIVPGLAQQKRPYDMGMADQVETAAITSGAKTVAYFSTGQSVLVGEADRRTTSLSELCGRKVGALRSSAGEDEVLRQNESGCGGGQPITYQPYDDGSAAVKDVLDDKISAYIDEYPGAVYLARVYGGLRVVPHKIAPAKEVMVFGISDTALRDAVAAALDKLQKNGTYKDLLQRWGLDEGGI
ncbi:MAG: transporter substrate-binding domain-containing protein [Candidatus Dormibacteraeota bacterium]|nr:transporter substrate-binding domain-containing protein [Candidatus Dormibacteraeota bacterium]